MICLLAANKGAQMAMNPFFMIVIRKITTIKCIFIYVISIFLYVNLNLMYMKINLMYMKIKFS